jgi:glucose-6-phosphate dehydrogenase assembly protein OpcA
MEADLMTTLSHPVSPADIEKELNRIWESFETTNVARACLFNLILFTWKNSRTPYIEKIAQKVVEKFPARVIFVAVDRETTQNFLKTEVSILSSSKGEFDVSCDYIHIETGGNDTQKVPFLLLPHILPDLPVYLLWGQDLCHQDPLFLALKTFANRLIFDSETTDNLPKFASRLLEQHHTIGSDIADLNWARMESWRELFSIAFHSKEKLAQVTRAKKISLTYNSKGTAFFCHTHIQALYLQAWLSCQLGWSFESVKREGTALVFSYTHSQGRVEISLLCANHDQLPPGLILSAEITTSEEECFSFTRDPKSPNYALCQHSSKSICDLPTHYPLTKAESGGSLVKEICHRGTSEHFLKVLNLIKTMDNLTLCS